MINEGSVTVAEDGGVLITIFAAGLLPKVETIVSVRGRRIRVGQDKTAHADFEIPSGHDWAIAALQATTDITVLEVGDHGFVEHRMVRKM